MAACAPVAGGAQPLPWPVVATWGHREGKAFPSQVPGRPAPASAKNAVGRTAGDHAKDVAGLGRVGYRLCLVESMLGTAGLSAAQKPMVAAVCMTMGAAVAGGLGEQIAAL